MSLYAIDDIEDAIAATRALLWPIDGRRWTKLAVVVFFIGSVSGTSPFQFGGTGSVPSGTPGAPGAPGMPGSVPPMTGPVPGAVWAIAALVAVLVVGFVLVGSIMEFVFVRALQREEVAIRADWSAYWPKGLRLFGFRVLLGGVSLGVIAALVVLVAAPGVIGYAGISAGVAVLAVPLAGLLALTAGLLNGFTTTFVVPIMILEDRGILGGWRRFWPTLATQWKQYLAYVLVGTVLRIAVGVLAGIVTALLAILVAIPVGLVLVLGAAVITAAELAGGLIIAAAVVVLVIAVVIISLFVAVPMRTFLRYYALLILGDTEAEFDVVAERRTEIRG